jgi:hypothetical protein
MKKASYYNTEPTMYATIAEAVNLFRINRKMLMKLAEKHGALIVVCDRVKRIDIEKLRNALINNIEERQEHEET